MIDAVARPNVNGITVATCAPKAASSSLPRDALAGM